MKHQKKIRSFAAALSDPRFRHQVAQTDKGKKDPKADRRAWKRENHAY